MALHTGMGLFDTLANWLGLRRKQAKVICVGLDNSGKTTIINKMKPEMVRPQKMYLKAD